MSCDKVLPMSCYKTVTYVPGLFGRHKLRSDGSASLAEILYMGRPYWKV